MIDPTVVGYARVSTRDQDPDMQIAALREAGAVRVFWDHGLSSRSMDRPEWHACVEYMRPGDTLLVYRLDRIAGSEKHLIEILNDLGERDINIRSLTEPEIDTTTPMGRALFGIVAVFAQLRVDTIRQNTLDGLAHAREQGRLGGRPTVMTPERIAGAVSMAERGMSQSEIGRALGVSRATVGRTLRRAREGDFHAGDV